MYALLNDSTGFNYYLFIYLFTYHLNRLGRYIVSGGRDNSIVVTDLDHQKTLGTIQRAFGVSGTKIFLECCWGLGYGYMCRRCDVSLGALVTLMFSGFLTL